MAANRKLNSYLKMLGLVLIVVVALAACAPAATPAPSNTITDINWQWTSVANKTTKATTTVPNPENYTIIFKTDGTLTGKADCNSFSGTYSQANGFISPRPFDDGVLW